MATVTIRNRKYVVETAITAEEQERGLSCRHMLDPNGGMLFVLSHPQIAAVWMKGVEFPLDVLWIDSKMKIAHMASLFPNGPSGLMEEKSTTVAIFILEIPGGEIASWGFSIGDEVGIR